MPLHHSHMREEPVRKRKKKDILLLLATMWQSQSTRKIPPPIRFCYMQFLKKMSDHVSFCASALSCT